ncbi:MAG: hypothetical protein IT458_20130 [Planctomycetes bacterium]|nr:hypothetical protein [Planctomycetota bacterium]
MLKKDTFPDVKPAKYALPKGVPALQEDPQETRRTVVFWGLGALASGLGLGALATQLFATPAAAPEPEANPFVALARDLARGPLPDLERNHQMLTHALRHFGDDATLWFGVERLLPRALAGQGREAEALQQDLLLTASLVPPPARLQRDLRELRERLRTTLARAEGR